MFEGEPKSKPPVDMMGGWMSAGSGSDIGSGVTASLSLLESDDSRIRFDEPDSEDTVREEGVGDDSWNNEFGDDMMGFGLRSRCAMLVPLGTRFGNGATFLGDDAFILRGLESR